MTTTELLSTTGQHKVKVAVGNTFKSGDILRIIGFKYLSSLGAWVISEDDWATFGGMEEWKKRKNPTYGRAWSNAIGHLQIGSATITQ